MDKQKDKTWIAILAKNMDKGTNGRQSKEMEKTGKLKCKRTAGTKDRQTDRQNNRHDRYIDKQTYGKTDMTDI